MPIKQPKRPTSAQIRATQYRMEDADYPVLEAFNRGQSRGTRIIEEQLDAAVAGTKLGGQNSGKTRQKKLKSKPEPKREKLIAARRQAVLECIEKMRVEGTYGRPKWIKNGLLPYVEGRTHKAVTIAALANDLRALRLRK